MGAYKTGSWGKGLGIGECVRKRCPCGCLSSPGISSPQERPSLLVSRCPDVKASKYRKYKLWLIPCLYHCSFCHWPCERHLQSTSPSETGLSSGPTVLLRNHPLSFWSYLEKTPNGNFPTFQMMPLLLSSLLATHFCLFFNRKYFHYFIYVLKFLGAIDLSRTPRLTYFPPQSKGFGHFDIFVCF